MNDQLLSQQIDEMVQVWWGFNAKLEQRQINEMVQVWQHFCDAIEKAICALVKIWEQFKQAIGVIVARLFDLPIAWRWSLYCQWRTRHQWIPQQLSAFVAWRCPLWLVIRLAR